MNLLYNIVCPTYHLIASSRRPNPKSTSAREAPAEKLLGDIFSALVYARTA